MTAIADVASGDIVALSNMRTNSTGQVFPAEDNSALVSVYEPGSVTKVITIAAALENGVVSPDTRFNVPDHMQVSDHNFKDDEPHKEAMLTPGEILTNSSNIGTIKIAQALGRKQIDRYMRGFGLGLKTGINFPGESAGILPALKQWTGTSIGTVPIGQGLAVTALQMLGVYTTIANKGVRVPLHLVHSTIDKNGIERKLKTADPVRVVSEQTAAQVKDMLESVVRSGTGKKAQVKGYRVAGKTGTAQKPNEHSRGYKKDAYVASFIGFFPAEHPRFAILCLLDEPKTSIYGGATAAPLFAEIAHFLGQHYRIPPSSGFEVTTDQIVTTAESSITLGASREMRAVAQAGSWQQAEIRKAATLGVAGVVANSELVNPPTVNVAQPESGVQPSISALPQTTVGASSAVPAVASRVPSVQPVVPIVGAAGIETPPVGAEASSLSPFAVSTVAPVIASVTPTVVAVTKPLVGTPGPAEAVANAAAAAAPTQNESGVPTVESPAVRLQAPSEVVQPWPLPVQTAPRQPPATVPDLSTWRRNGKAVARAQVLATAIAPIPTTTIAKVIVKAATQRSNSFATKLDPNP
jgi:membrane peptidoglycan carboxypeptidase